MMKTGELARRSAVTAYTIRYDGRIGLIPKAARDSSKYRDYHASMLTWMGLSRSFEDVLEEHRARVRAYRRAAGHAGMSRMENEHDANRIRPEPGHRRTRADQG
jgi:DNA-binding transcriptional MerR regulator